MLVVNRDFLAKISPGASTPEMFLLSARQRAEVKTQIVRPQHYRKNTLPKRQV